VSLKFNLNGLTNIYLEALNRSDPTLAFEITEGKGRFVFLMFFSNEDKTSKDRLFLHLRNTNTFLELKMYGSHKNGIFDIYFQDSDKESIINELQLGNGRTAFEFSNFLEKLNENIPQILPLQEKLDKIREIWPRVQYNLPNIVDQADKTILIGIKRLPNRKKPQDKTLRKLYIYTNGDATVLTNLIEALKEANTTLAWTNNNQMMSKSLAEIMALINA
jgi:hypothetical protein